MPKWVKPDSQFATGTRGRVSASIRRQQADADADAAAKAKQDKQLSGSKADKAVRQQRRRG
jgi:hypothetical protein